MSLKCSPLPTLLRLSLVKILSINVALSLVILVGFTIAGNRLILYIMSIKSHLGLKSTSKSPEIINHLIIECVKTGSWTLTFLHIYFYSNT